METQWQIEMLGWLRASQDARVIAAFRSRKTGALLAYLAHHSHRSHPRELLIEMLWPGCTPARGRTNLRTELAWLRQRLEPPGVEAGTVLQTDGDTLRLNPARCRTDVAGFESALLAAENAHCKADRECRLADAVRLYQGEFLPGYFEAWLAPERVRLAEAFLQAAHELVVEREKAGDLAGALQIGWRAAGVDPLREETHADLLRLLAAAGQAGAALRQHQERQRLLGVEHCWGQYPVPGVLHSSSERALLQRLHLRTTELQALRQQLAVRTAEVEEAVLQLEIERAQTQKLRHELAARTAEARELQRQLGQSDRPRCRSRYVE